MNKIISEIVNFFSKVGDCATFSFNSALSIKKTEVSQLVLQMLEIGYFSLPIVAVSAFFTGSVLALQSYMGFGSLQSEFVIAKIVAVSLVREIGPVLVGIVVSGKIASSVTAEIGSMKVTEQIDVIQSLSVNHYGYLVLPRIIAGIVSFPIIALIADIIGIFGGYAVCVYKFDFNSAFYIKNVLQSLDASDFFAGIIKCSIFGLTSTLVSCYNGINCTMGAKGVGNAVTNSVVASFVLILIFNYLVTLLMFY